MRAVCEETVGLACVSCGCVVKGLQISRWSEARGFRVCNCEATRRSISQDRPRLAISIQYRVFLPDLHQLKSSQSLTRLLVMIKRPLWSRSRARSASRRRAEGVRVVDRGGSASGRRDWRPTQPWEEKRKKKRGNKVDRQRERHADHSVLYGCRYPAMRRLSRSHSVLANNNLRIWSVMTRGCERRPFQCHGRNGHWPLDGRGCQPCRELS